MPPPRLPRHLRPCRPLWSARQVRFASDTPPTAGDDNANSARSTEGKSQTSQARSAKIYKHWTARGYYGKLAASEMHLKKREKLQQAQQSATPTQTDVSFGSGSGYKAVPSPSPTAPVTESVTRISQAQRMRRALGGTSAPDATPQPTIHRVHRPAPHLSKESASDTWHTNRFGSTRRLAPESTAISAHLEEKERLQQEQQAEASTRNEDELRERLRKLQGQLTLLQARLAADNAAAAESKEQPAAGEGTATNGETAEAKASDSTPSKAPDAAHAEQSDSTKAETKSAKRRKEKGNSAAQGGGGRAEEKPSRTRKPDKSSPPEAKPPGSAEKSDQEMAETSPKTLNTTLAQQIHAQSTSMKSSSHPQPSQPTPQALTASDEVSEQSLLDELFPEASSLVQPDLSDRRPSPPKLDLPAPDTNPHIRLTLSDTRTDREKTIDSFRARGEQTTVLQLSNCSTALTESDFRRLIPRGAHIEAWSSSGEFYKIIPGRDPLSLARLPFYYLLFHSQASALAYQKNASRLSKLSALHAPSSIASAVAPPAGFLENGEDIAAVTSSFVLHPQGHALDLRTVMQPYNRVLRSLIDAGGYTPIVPNVDEKGRKIHRVLLHIDGYEPSHWDLWQIISRHAHARGIIWSFRNDHASALRRLRDAVNLRTVGRQKFQATAASNPRASIAPSTSSNDGNDGEGIEYEDPSISAFLGPSSPNASQGDGNSTKEINQLVMNRVYNRWIVEFEDEDAARRFAGLWHRVVLPGAKERNGAWKEAEEERWVEAEYLW